MPETSPKPQENRDQVDWSEALKVTGGDEQLLTDLAVAFLQEAPAMLSRIETAIDNRDAELLRRSAHTVKGSLRPFGAPKMASEYAWQIEQIGAKPDPRVQPVEEVTVEDWSRTKELYGLLNEKMQPILDAMKERVKK
ncbi:MAG: Hpt domain-containing protein [Pirellulaceae bacterium]|nr:Hpt domain-containing protein [Pirellulaceae bacterium]